MSYRRRRNTTFEPIGPLSRTTLDDDERDSPLLPASPTHHHVTVPFRPQERRSPSRSHRESTTGDDFVTTRIRTAANTTSCRRTAPTTTITTTTNSSNIIRSSCYNYHVTRTAIHPDFQHKPQRRRQRRMNASIQKVPYYIFLLGGLSIGAVLLLQLYSFFIISHMTHLQNIHNNNHSSVIQWSPFWWLWQSNDDPHRRVNTLLRTSSDVGNASDVQRKSLEEHVFPTIVQLENSWTDRVDHRFRHVQRPKTLPFRFRHDQNQPDNGNLQHRRPITPQQRSNHNRTRPTVVIRSNDYELNEQYRQHIIDQIDVPNANYYYHKYDDLDFSSLNRQPDGSNSITHPLPPPYNNEEDPASCERPTWGYDNSKINCNTVHELHPSLADGLSQNSIQTLGHGYFRDTYLIRQPQPHVASTTIDDEYIVMKQLRYVHPQNRQFQYEINMEAMIMEITTSSNVTSAIYGHCSTTILVESLQEVTHAIVPLQKQYQPIRGRVSDATLHYLESVQAKKINRNTTGTTSLSEPYSFNNLTVYEKLHYARQMAQALAEMHGYHGGVIVHDDVHPDQWLISRDKKRIVLNDMNNAVILQWSRPHHKYCTYWDKYGGDYRAPEMYTEAGTYNTNEQADVYPMGNLIYSLITGLYPYHNVTSNDEKVIHQLTMNPNVRPYLHPKLRRMGNSVWNDHHGPNVPEDVLERYILSRLIHIMGQCHEMEPNDRPSIFDVYQFVSQTQQLVDTYLQKKKSHHDLIRPSPQL